MLGDAYGAAVVAALSSKELSAMDAANDQVDEEELRAVDVDKDRVDEESPHTSHEVSSDVPAWMMK